MLSDEKKRAQYDTFGHSTNSGQTGFGGYDFNQGFGGFSAGGGEGINFEDIFDMFGSSFGGQTRQDIRGRDIEAELTVSLTEALLGGVKVFDIERQKTCDICGGSGAKPGTDIGVCSICNGKGEVHQHVRSLFGSFTQAVVCSNCKGGGKAPKELCKDCKGEGRVRGRERVEIDLPSGVAEGETFSIKSKGQAGYREAMPGNLHLRVHIKMPRKLSRRARELVEELSREL